MCDYFYYRNTQAALDGFSIAETDDSFYLKILVESLNIPNKMFYVYSRTGRYWEIFLPDNLAGLITMFYKSSESGGYAGMNLEEFVQTVYSEGRP